MSGIFQLLGGLAPQGPTNAAREYDGFELRWKMFVFRPATFKFEGIMLAILGLYVAIHLVGKAINMGRARKTVDAFTPLVTDNFTSVRPLLSSSSALHLLYATGRRNVLCLQATLKLQPLHDIISLIWQTVWSIIEPTSDNSEALEVDLTLGRGASGLQGEAAGVWAIIDKGSLTKTRTRFDLVSGIWSGIWTEGCGWGACLEAGLGLPVQLSAVGRKKGTPPSPAPRRSGSSPYCR